MKMFKSVLVAAGMFVASAGLMTAPTTAHASGYICTHTGSNVMLRSGAGKNFRIVARMPSGSYVNVLNSTYGRDGMVWYRVNYNGRVGFARADYVC